MTSTPAEVYQRSLKIIADLYNAEFSLFDLDNELSILRDALNKEEKRKTILLERDALWNPRETDHSIQLYKTDIEVEESKRPHLLYKIRRLKEEAAKLDAEFQNELKMLETLNGPDIYKTYNYEGRVIYLFDKDMETIERSDVFPMLKYHKISSANIEGGKVDSNEGIFNKLSDWIAVLPNVKSMFIMHSPYIYEKIPLI